MQEDVKFKMPFASLIFYFLLIILAVFVFLNVTKLEEFFSLIKQIQPAWFALALCTQIMTYVLEANVFYAFLIQLNRKDIISRLTLFKLAITSLSLGQITPFLGLGNQGYIVYFLTKRKWPAQKSFLLVLLENITYYFVHSCFALFALVFLLLFLKEQFGGVLLGASVLGIVLFTFLDVALLLLGSKKALIFIGDKVKKGRVLTFFLKKINFNFPGRAVLLEDWESPVHFIKKKGIHLLKPALLQMLVIFTDACTLFFLFQGFNFRTHFLIVLVGMIVTKGIALLAVSPGALVFFEGAMVLFYSSFNLPVQLVIAVTLLFRALSFWLPIPFGLFFYKQFVHDKKHQHGINGERLTD